MTAQKPDTSKKPAGVFSVPALGAEDFAALMERFAPFSASPKIAVAVSGGPDSTALAFCAQRWLDERHEGGTVLALIVDHDLRKESAREAVETERTLANLGIDAEILHWQHGPLAARLHEAARKARYALLFDACKRYGMTDLLFAHHREDQAETILMRFAKGSGIAGLAGMPSESNVDGLRILRPFLNVPKERLVATCAAAGLPFVSDPSNASQKYARGRLRRVMPLLAAEGFTPERLADLGERAAEAQEALDHAAYALVRVASARDDGGAIRIDLEHLRSAPRAIALLALNICLNGIHREDYSPERSSLTRVLDALCEDGAMSSSTLRGVLITKNNTHVSMMRELAAVDDDQSVNPGTPVIWDQRWRVTLSADISQVFSIRPLGNPPVEIIDKLAPDLRTRISQGRVRASYPSLWLKGQLALIPSLQPLRGGSEAHAELALVWPPAQGKNQ